MIGWLILYNRQQRLRDEIEALKRQLPPPPVPAVPPRGNAGRVLAWTIILFIVVVLALSSVHGAKP